MPLIRALLLAAALGLVAGGCGGGPTGGPIVLVSGRDDHGLVYRAAVGLAAAPGETTYPASVPDGTFARVVEQRGEWKKVQAIGSEATGWVNDYYLRTVAVGLEPPRQVVFLDAALRDGVVSVRVRPVGAASGDGTWVPATTLTEVGATAP